jgi:ubiquinone/menaquinone biosynthesis C-methylase UbiE
MSEYDRYKVISSFYDLFDLIFLLGGKGNPRRILPEVIRNEKLKVLDICVGTASSSLILAATNDRIHVTGIDISEQMLSAARKKINDRAINSIELLQMPADDLKFGNESFDVAMVSFALHEIESGDRETILKEAARVIKHGGKLCIIDFSRQKDWRNRLFIWIWTVFEPKGFSDYLDIDWRTALNVYQLRFIEKKDFSFSSFYTFEKYG